MSTGQLTLDDRFPWEEEEEQQPAATATPDDDGVSATPALDDGEDVLLELQPSAPVAHNRPVALKEYYSISEVCDLVGLKPHVLRYWETQFQVLNPSKNRSGNRVYQRKEIRLILLVKHLLYEEKYTVEGAKAKLDQMRRGGQVQQAAGHTLDRQMIELLRSEVEQLRKILTLPGTS